MILCLRSSLNLYSRIDDEHPWTPVTATGSLSMTPRMKIGIGSPIWTPIGRPWLSPWPLVWMTTCLLRIRNSYPRRAINPWNLLRLVTVRTVHNPPRLQSCHPMASRPRVTSFNGCNNRFERCSRNTCTFFSSRRISFSFHCSSSSYNNEPQPSRHHMSRSIRILSFTSN